MADTLSTINSKRIYNFSAGPSCLPESVLSEAHQDFMNWKGSGMGIIEMSHRDADGPVQNYMSKAEQSLRNLLDIPDNYSIIFMQGGAHGQFAAVPLNLLGKKKQADYLMTGFWSQRAIDEASKYCQVKIVADVASSNFSSIPPVSEWKLNDDSAYVHICANETIVGLEFLEDPQLPSDKILVADMTSTLLSRPVKIERYGCIYASGGKNLGPAGFCVVIIRNDLLDIESQPITPSILDYKKNLNTKPIGSLYNTPPTFSLYLASLVFDDLLNSGGLQNTKARATKRANELYSIIDEYSDFYENHINPTFRSRMNIPFRIKNRNLESKFLEQAKNLAMVQLFGHISVGGLRVTLYNSIPDEATTVLSSFMRSFAQENSTAQ